MSAEIASDDAIPIRRAGPPPADLGPLASRARPTAALPERWRRLIQATRVAFQPIVNIHTGHTFGYEALLRGIEATGFGSVADLLDAAADDGLLARVEVLLQDRAMAAFARIDHAAGCKLFSNLDSRAIGHPEFGAEVVVALADRHGLAHEAICIELSELERPIDPEDSAGFEGFRARHIGLAIDDFGRGSSGLERLYQHRPDYIKIDRLFIAGVAEDRRKRLILASSIRLAQSLGIGTVAEGVETEAEYRVCRELGCGLLQGYLVARPSDDVDLLQPTYSSVARLARRDRRRATGERTDISNFVDPVPPVSMEIDLLRALDAFRANKERTFLPVIDRDRRPVGIVRESDIKEYVYSPFGRDLLVNRRGRRRVGEHVTPCPAVDAGAPLDVLLDAFRADEGQAGVIVTRQLEYAGFLSARALLGLVSARELARARDQNPLTRLPGNSIIYEYLSEALDDPGEDYALVYFDFDHFKPFNDALGFRQGDRASLMFAEMLGQRRATANWFVGHVGGDDFFAACRTRDADGVLADVADLRAKFAHDVESLYDAAIRQRRSLDGVDRDGRPRVFPLLTVSAVALHLPAGRPAVTLDRVSSLIAAGKKRAKAGEGLTALVLDVDEGRDQAGDGPR